MIPRGRAMGRQRPHRKNSARHDQARQQYRSKRVGAGLWFSSALCHAGLVVAGGICRFASEAQPRADSAEGERRKDYSPMTAARFFAETVSADQNSRSGPDVLTEHAASAESACPLLSLSDFGVVTRLQHWSTVRVRPSTIKQSSSSPPDNG